MWGGVCVRVSQNFGENKMNYFMVLSIPKSHGVASCMDHRCAKRGQIAAGSLAL